MASAGPAPTGKRAYDAEINLVPFIDLLSCCICFLLISAVWTQMAKIDVKPKPNLPGEDQPPEQHVNLTVHVRSTGYFLSDGTSNLELPKVAGAFPTADLDTKMGVMHEAYPDITAITVMSDDAVAYKELVGVMDLCLKYGLGDITVASSGV
jgi:biopolymer transport protein ExbD